MEDYELVIRLPYDVARSGVYVSNRDLIGVTGRGSSHITLRSLELSIIDYLLGRVWHVIAKKIQ